MMPYGTAAEAEAALGRSMTWAEALWFRYSAGMPDLWLTWHVSLVYLVLYVLVPLPVMVLQKLAPGYALRHKLQPGVPEPSPVSTYVEYIRDSRGVTLAALGPFPLIYSIAFKVSLSLSRRMLSVQGLIRSIVYMQYAAVRGPDGTPFAVGLGDCDAPGGVFAG